VTSDRDGHLSCPRVLLLTGSDGGSQISGGKKKNLFPSVTAARSKTPQEVMPMAVGLLKHHSPGRADGLGDPFAQAQPARGQVGLVLGEGLLSACGGPCYFRHDTGGPLRTQGGSGQDVDLPLVVLAHSLINSFRKTR
jgi:hypothetical protein